MTLTFYKCAADKNVVNKTAYLQELTKISGVKALDTIEKGEPRFSLKMSGLINNANYCYCDLTGRYYWIKDLELASGKRSIITCTVDPLMSFKESILNNGGWIEVAEKEVNED